jgi:heterodisulfide reductase subunit A-like polyferredoxin
MQINIPSRQVDVLAQADVVVCGGGCSGVAAAVSAARHGVSVILVERWPTVGGNSFYTSRRVKEPKRLGMRLRLT